MLCARYIEEIGIGEITFAGSHVVLDEPILFEQGFLLFGEVLAFHNIAVLVQICGGCIVRETALAEHESLHGRQLGAYGGQEREIRRHFRVHVLTGHFHEIVR